MWKYVTLPLSADLPSNQAPSPQFSSSSHQTTRSFSRILLAFVGNSGLHGKGLIWTAGARDVCGGHLGAQMANAWTGEQVYALSSGVCPAILLSTQVLQESAELQKWCVKFFSAAGFLTDEHGF